MLNLYKRIWQHTGRSQVLLIVLSLIVAGLAAAPLRFQKDIINSLGPDLVLESLITMCVGYLGVIFASNVFKFLLNYRSSLLGERTIRFIRKRIYSQRFDPDVSQQRDMGTLTTIIAAEAEEVGRFAGVAIANPLLQIGTLISVISYIASTQPYLGGFLVLIVVPQAVVVLLLQARVNRRVRARTLILREATSAISVEQIDQMKGAQQGILDDFDEIFTTRRGIFRLKLSMKFAMNLLNGIGLIGILMIGGLLMMNGRSDVGTVVASIAALERISDPWRQLLNFYKELSSVRVKFDLIVGTARMSS
ncbi:ABC transporter ATP-binding protein [Shimia sp.]|uniref:ABC transporter ATP-binding protein n=1 Tax=Shimia sp. TaxID=1954381 RepID=UPI0032987E26